MSAMRESLAGELDTIASSCVRYLGTANTQHQAKVGCDIVRWRNGNAHITRVCTARLKSKLYGGINTGSNPVLTTNN